MAALLSCTHLTIAQLLKLKNVKVIAMLLHIGHYYGVNLHSAWYEVLMCISLLDRVYNYTEDSYQKFGD